MENQQKYKIVVADDEEDIRMIVKRYLAKRMDAEIIAVESGELAVQAARDMKPDLMFLDVTLTGMSGWHVVEEVRKFDQHTRIVMVSGHDSVPERFVAIAKTEVSEYLQKPVLIENLYEVAIRVLKNPASQSGEFFTPSANGELVSVDKVAHDLSNIQMTIQMHCAHFLSTVQDGCYVGADQEKVIKDAAESFETIQRKCFDLEVLINNMRRTDKGGTK